MKIKFDIKKILKLAAILSVIVLISACGRLGEPTTLSENPTASSDDKQVSQQEMFDTHKECWQASLVGTIYETTGKLTMQMYGDLSHGAMALMMTAFALWLAWQVMKHVSSFTEESPAELWTEVFKKFFVCFVCGLLATSTEGVLFVLNSIIFPVYNAFLELGSEMLKQNNGGALSEMDIPLMGTVTMKDRVCALNGIEKASLSGFPDGPRAMMECLTCAVNERLNFGIYLGWVTIQQGVLAALCGVFLVLSFFIVKLAFAFYVIDAIFRFALVTMMLPLLIMSYAFKSTSKCAKTGFYAILNSGAFMMMIAIIIIMLFSAIQNILSRWKGEFEDVESYNDVGVPLLLMLLMVFLAVGALQVAKTVCDSLVCAGSGGETNMAKQFGTFAAQSAKGLFRRVAMATGNFALANSKFLRNTKAGADNAMARLNHWAGRQ